MTEHLSLNQKTILVTGGAKRIGRAICLGIAREGGNLIIHHGHSFNEAQSLQREIINMGRDAYIIKADLSNPEETQKIIPELCQDKDIYAIINNAAIFAPEEFRQTSLGLWEEHLRINLTAPFLLSQAFSNHFKQGKIINILDWRALRPGADHFAYTISKAGLAALTQSLAIALAPNFQVNGIALGAILPPSNGSSDETILENVPSQRWAMLKEVIDTIMFLLTGPSYITGEIIHLDGGRHLV